MATTLTAGNKATFDLDAFGSVTVSSAGAVGTFSANSYADNLKSDVSENLQSRTFGPYGVPMAVTISVAAGSVNYTINRDAVISSQLAALGKGQTDLSGFGDTSIVLSGLLQHGRFSSDVGDRAVAITGGATTNSVQEPAPWYYNGKYYMLATRGFASPGLWLYWSPSRGGPWTVVGNAAVISGRYHSFVYIEGGTVYCYAPDSATDTHLHVHTASAAAIETQANGGAAATWTDVTSWEITATITGMTLWGNVCLFKDPDTSVYHLLAEGSTAAASWQMAYCTMDTPTGTITAVDTLITSLRPSAGNATATVSGPNLFKEGSTYVLFYHCGVSGSLPTSIYKATCTDLSADAWTIKNNGQPIITRQHKYEVDQVADIAIVQDPTTGRPYAYWTAMDNTAQASYIMGAPMRPGMVENINGTWVSLGGESQPNPGILIPSMPVVKSLTADVSLSSTTWADVSADVSNIRFIPKSNTILVRLSGVASNGTGSASNYFRITDGGSVTQSLGVCPQPTGGGTQFPISSAVKISGLTPGQRYGFKLQYQVSGGTLVCRPVTQSDKELLTVVIEDVMVPNYTA